MKEPIGGNERDTNRSVCVMETSEEESRRAPHEHAPVISNRSKNHDENDGTDDEQSDEEDPRKNITDKGSYAMVENHPDCDHQSPPQEAFANINRETKHDENNATEPDDGEHYDDCDGESDIGEADDGEHYDDFDAESDIWETPGELQHGAAIGLSVTEPTPTQQEQHEPYEKETDDSSISLSAQPEIFVDGEENSVDLSSVGMGSTTHWDEQHIFNAIPPRLRNERRHYSWNPSSSRGRPRRWDSHHAFTIRPISQSPRRTAPIVAHEDAINVEALPPLQQEESSSSSSIRPAKSSSHFVIDESTGSTINHRHHDEQLKRGEEDDVPLSFASPYTLLGAPDSKYEEYHCVVDSSQEDRAVEIQLGSMARPHMRAFHLAWMAFFVAFFTWFALTPLLSEIAISLNLTKEEIWTSSILGVAGSAVTRILIGPVCDKYGARWAMAGTLFLSAIPMALTGLAQTSVGLSILRLFIGLAGSAFVTSQYWTSSMFTPEVAGTANALVAGWGNLGGGVTQLVMGSLVFPILKIAYGGEGWSRAAHNTGEERAYDRPSDLAWRTCCVVPALMCFLMTYFVIFKADDCPMGNYIKRNRDGFMPSVSATKSVISGMHDFNTWILFIQYGCCFGVEITMINAAALYFTEEFGLSTELSAAVASIFGWMNLFARGLGGFLSDILSSKRGMRGRLWIQIVSLLIEGALVIMFSKTLTLGGAIVAMIAFSIFVQAAEGSTYGIVPYVNPSVTGSVSGIVGAGGNVGGVLFAAIFRAIDYRDAFSAMGWAAMISAALTIPIAIKGHASLFCGSDAEEVLDRRTSRFEEMGTNIPSVAVLQNQSWHRRSVVLDGNDTI